MYLFGIGSPGRGRYAGIFSRTLNTRLINGVALAGVASLLVAIATLFVGALQIEFWRHDAYVYLNQQDLDWRTLAEGRWLNALMFPVLGRVDPMFGWYATSVLTLVGLYLLFLAMELDRLTALGLAATAWLFPGVIAQSLWPLVTLAAVGCFVVSVLLVRRFGLLSLPLVGVAQFATIPYYFYLMPLTLLHKSSDKGWRPALSLFSVGLLWAACLILGYLVASTWNLVVSGEFGIQLDEHRFINWRSESPGVIEKLRKYYWGFRELVFAWLPIWSIVFYLVIMGLALFRWNSGSRHLWSLLVRLGFGLVVIFASYITVFADGIKVFPRSLLPVAVGLIAMPYLITYSEPRSLAWNRATMVALVVAIGFPSFQVTQKMLEWYSSFSQTAMAAVRVETGLPLSGFDGVAIDTRAYESFHEGVILRAGISHSMKPFMLPLYRPKSIGAAYQELVDTKSVLLCPIKRDEALSELCLGLFSDTEVQCNGLPGSSCYLGQAGNRLLFRVQ